MSTNAFLRLRQLLPQPQLLIARVLSHDVVNDTSVLELPTGQPDTDFTGGLVTGAQFTARGRAVAVGLNAFVRGGVVESQAPDRAVSVIEIGRVVP